MEHRDRSKLSSKVALSKSAAADAASDVDQLKPVDLFAIDLQSGSGSGLMGLDANGDQLQGSSSDPFEFDLSGGNITDLSASDSGSPETFDPFSADLPTLPVAVPAQLPVTAASAANHPPASNGLASATQSKLQPVTSSGAVIDKAAARRTQATPTQATPTAGNLNADGTAAEAAAEADSVAPLTQADVVKRRFYLTALPSWAISLGVHVALLFLLAAMSMDPIREAIGTALEAGGGNEGETLTDTELPGQMQTAEAEESSETFSAPVAMVSEVVTMPEIATTEISSVAGAASLSLNSVTESVLPSAMMGSGLSRVATSLNGRSAGMRGEMLERFGGTANSEKSVAAALEWIAKHQAPNGGWTFACSKLCRGQCKDDGRKVEAVNAATALALLPFLGAGQTHLKGKYKDTIKQGLAFLINNMKATPGKLPRGSWHEAGGSMYSHGLASIVICEAYAMTRDPDLVQPAQLAINYLVYAQDPRGGGWWYQPQQPGDTSVAGWCIMALKSGSMANLTVPPETFRGASQFLDFVSTNDGAYYGYLKPSANVRPSLTSVGLLCRMYMGWSKDEKGIKEGVALLSKTGPKMDDFYFNYYATQVMRHYGGEEWEKWNTKMRDSLINSQSSVGHEAGSWFSAGNHGIDGGRLYSTALATMILEVYYRHMPLYTEKSADDEFEL